MVVGLYFNKGPSTGRLLHGVIFMALLSLTPYEAPAGIMANLCQNVVD